MPRTSKLTSHALPPSTLVIDNGAHTIKAGFAHPDPSIPRDCRTIPNCIARGTDARRQPRYYIADQLESCRDFAEMAFRRPVEKGYLVNWDSEMDIWKQAFLNEGTKLHCDPHETNLILTEAPNCPQGLQHNTDQMIFEEFQFASTYRCIGPILTAHNTPDPAPEALLVIDSGHSHTTITPILRNRPLHQAIRRLDVGGKLLTNRLKELISQRHFNLMDEPHTVAEIKEDNCFVSLDFKRDLERSWKVTSNRNIPTNAADPPVVEYVLPDYHNSIRGHVRPYDPSAKSKAQSAGGGPLPLKQKEKEDCFPLSNERFTVPELLFSPSDISIAQAGLAETVVQSLSALPQGLWPAMLANVVCTGGTTCLPGFVERLERELTSLSPDVCQVRVKRTEDPIRSTWLGGARLAGDIEGRGRFKELCVTRQEYEEHGAGWTSRKFAMGDK